MLNVWKCIQELRDLQALIGTSVELAEVAFVRLVTNKAVLGEGSASWQVNMEWTMCFVVGQALAGADITPQHVCFRMVTMGRPFIPPLQHQAQSGSTASLSC